MTPIDPEKLEEALPLIKAYAAGKPINTDRFDAVFDVVISAARAHLATLPRVKEVEFVQWATFTTGGAIWSSALSEEAARAEAECSQSPKLVAVRLTGTAKVKVPQ